MGVRRERCLEQRRTLHERLAPSVNRNVDLF